MNYNVIDDFVCIIVVIAPDDEDANTINSDKAVILRDKVVILRDEIVILNEENMIQD